MKTYLSAAAIWVAVFGTAFIPSVHEAEAADIRVTPSIRLAEGWDSNVFGTGSNEISDFYTSVTPEVNFEAASPTLSMRLRAGAEGRWYKEQTELSSAGYSKYAYLSPVEGWKPTTRFSVLPAVYFLETRNSLARSSLVPPSTFPSGAGNRDVRAAENPRFRGLSRSSLPGASQGRDRRDGVRRGAPVPGSYRRGQAIRAPWAGMRRCGTPSPRRVPADCTGPAAGRSSSYTPMSGCSGPVFS